jgi:aminoglycoside phosphotransferase (APT) family kinase protein
MYRDGEIAAVIDWDMTHTGAAETDMAWFLAVEWLNGDEGLGGRPFLEGMPDKKESIRIYESAVGRDLEDFFYHEAFAFFRLGIIFGRVVKSIPGIPPEYIPQNLPLLKLANMLGIEDKL